MRGDSYSVWWLNNIMDLGIETQIGGIKHSVVE